MREPMSWSLPLFRIFGISVKVHIMYIVLTFALFMRAYSQNPALWFDYLMVVVVMVFCLILIHELGHCFAARQVDGEADEILMWPLGGLAFCRPPMTPMAHFITAVGGPATHLVFCLITGLALLLGGFMPPLNPLRTYSAFSPVLRNLQDGKNYASPEFGPPLVNTNDREINWVQIKYYHPGGKKEVRTSYASNEWIPVHELDFQPLPTWALWTARFFYLNLALFCFNVFIPAFPMDGGRILQTIVWGRTDFEKGTVVACYAGQGISIALLILSIWFDIPIQMLAIFIWYCSYVELKRIYEPEGDGMYDTSKGYMAFDEGEAPVRSAPKQNLLKRWLQARTARRIQKEIEQQQADDARMDELLAKLHSQGKSALTADERRFLDRMSQRYKGKDE